MEEVSSMTGQKWAADLTPVLRVGKYEKISPLQYDSKLRETSVKNSKGSIKFSTTLRE